MQNNSPDNGWGASIIHKAKNSHKYDHGHVVVFGAEQMTGAVCLAAVSALRVGAGLVTIISPISVADIYRNFCPSLIVEIMTEFENHIKDTRRNVVLIGCGAGLNNHMALKKAVFDSLTIQPQKICVIDADALNIFAGDTDNFFQLLNDKCILTPHEGEFARLFPHIDVNLPKNERALMAAKITGAIIILKGSETIIAAPDGRIVINETGTSWLATAGTGDILAGMIAGFAARGILNIFDSACAAVWVHGMAGQNLGAGMISSDLPQEIPHVLKNLGK